MTDEQWALVLKHLDRVKAVALHLSRRAIQARSIDADEVEGIALDLLVDAVRRAHDKPALLYVLLHGNLESRIGDALMTHYRKTGRNRRLPMPDANALSYRETMSLDTLNELVKDIPGLDAYDRELLLKVANRGKCSIKCLFRRNPKERRMWLRLKARLQQHGGLL